MSKTINNLSKDLKDLVNHFDLVDYDGSGTSVDEIFDEKFNNMEEEISNINNNLNESTVTSITTENGAASFNCEQDGYLDNFVIHGKTFRNLIIYNDVEVWDDNRVAINLVDYKYNQGIYTLFNFSDNTIVLDICDESTIQWIRTFALDAYQTTVFTINPGEIIANVNGLFTDGWANTDSSKNDFHHNIVLLEGDKAEQIVYRFNGLMSIGESNPIELLTYDTTIDVTEELIGNIEWLEDQYVECHEIAPSYNTVVSLNRICSTKDFIELEPNTIYIFNNINHNLAFYDYNMTMIRKEKIEQFNCISSYPFGYTNGLYYLDTKDNIKFVKITANEYHKINGKIKIYKKSKASKNRIQQQLKSLPNGICDTIEKRDDEYILVQRCDEVVLTGTSCFKATEQITTGAMNVFNLYIDLGDREISIVTDKFKTLTSSGNVEGILYDYNYKRLRITTNRVNTFDELNEWLRFNNVRVIYELPIPVVSGLNNIDIQTFKGVNGFYLNSGTIQGDCSFDVNNSIRNELQILKQTTSSINNFNRYIDIKNQITFLNNWHYWGNEQRFGAYIVGNVVHINVLLSPNADNLAAYTPIFKINNKYKPIVKEFIPCITNGCIMAMGCLDLDGVFTFEHAIDANAAYVSISLTYPIKI